MSGQIQDCKTVNKRRRAKKMGQKEPCIHGAVGKVPVQVIRWDGNEKHDILVNIFIIFFLVENSISDSAVS